MISNLSNSDLVLASVSEGLVVHNERGEVIFHNYSSCELLGVGPNQMVGKTPLDFDWSAVTESGSFLDREKHPVLEALRSGLPVNDFTMGLLITGQSTKWLKINARPFSFEEKGSVHRRVVCTFTDITDLKLSQAEAEQAIFRLTTAAKVVGFGVWDWNLKSGHLHWDDSMYEIFDIEKSKFTSDYDAFEKSLIPEDAERVQRELREHFVQRKQEYLSHFFIKNKRNEIRNIAVGAKCFYDSQGNIEKLIGLNWDVTKEKTLERQNQNQRELLFAQEKMASLGEMVGSLAHEINNPLTVVIGRAEQLSKIISTEPIKKELGQKYLDSIIATSERISKIISSLGNFSRDSERDPLTEVSFSKIFSDTLTLCHDKMKKQSIQIIEEGMGESLVQCRPTQISQVLINLFINSMDAISGLNEKWIKVELDSVTDPRFFVLSVTDSGPGISLEIRHRIMEPFFTTKPLGRGTGLGLSISKGLVEQHGGKLELDTSSPNTKFNIYLPKS